MIVRCNYQSELVGGFTLASDGESLVGCWFGNDRFLGYGVDEEMVEGDDDVLAAARAWLDRYFAGDRPDPAELPLGARGSEFQHRVWDELVKIPYGRTVTYGDIAKSLETASGKRASAQAVGGAVGRNPLCVIVPCHRVMGAKGNLTGFGGGIATKVKLLEHEQVDMAGFFVPTKGTAL